MKKSISQPKRASQKQPSAEQLESTIYPAKYRITASAEGGASCETRAQRDTRGVSPAALHVQESKRYIEQEFAAGLQVVHMPAPGNNMGVTGIGHNGRTTAEYDGTELIVIKPKGKNGRYQLVKVPAQLDVYAPAAFIDQCSFTVYVSSIVGRETWPPYNQIKDRWPDSDAVSMVSSALVHIFGFGVSSKLEKGRNFYQDSYALGDYAQYGAVSCGGNNNGGTSSNTINVQITGQGCLVAAPGWEQRLYDWLEAVMGRLTRCDTAIDLYDGRYTPGMAFDDWQQGKYSLTNRKPRVQKHGSSWWNPDDDSGKTTEIGTRDGGKLTRVYEKGYEQLGKLAARTIDESHPLYHLKQWVRIETEWHRGNGRELPNEMLLEPGKYLAGGHPEALGWISEVQERIKVMKVKIEATVHRAEEFVVRQAGSALLALEELGRLDEVMSRIREKSKFPKWVYTLAPPDPERDDFETHEKLLDAMPF